MFKILEMVYVQQQCILFVITVIIIILVIRKIWFKTFIDLCFLLLLPPDDFKHLLYKLHSPWKLGCGI